MVPQFLLVLEGIYKSYTDFMKGWLTNFGLWLQLEKSNIIPALKIGLLFLLLFIAWRQGYQMVRKLFVLKMDGHAMGVIDTIIYVDGFQATKLGEKPVVKFYKLHYHFMVGNDIYHKEESIARETLSFRNRGVLKEAEKGDSIGIKYQKGHPNVSMVSFRE